MPDTRRWKIVTIVGARPNLMKAAPLIRAMRKRPQIEPILIHTGQHYDAAMSEIFFQELGMPEPSVNLGVGSGPQGAQTGQIMQLLEPVLAGLRPDCVVVVGDVNSTMAAALVGAKLGIRIAHVEAGLRSFDRTMPEEINRVVTDAVSDYFFTTSRDADEQLAREGVPAERVFFTGNVMIDTLVDCLPRARRLGTPARLNLVPGAYAVLTLHRPSSVDEDATLARVLTAIEAVQARLPVVFPAHPRTAAQLKKHGRAAGGMPRLTITGPLGYLEFLGLLAEARVVLTDSGGVQEETTALGVPCVTLRANTERPVTITHGTNRLAGHDPDRIVAAVDEILSAPRPASAAAPPLWDGHAGERIVQILIDQLASDGTGARHSQSAPSRSSPPSSGKPTL